MFRPFSLTLISFTVTVFALVASAAGAEEHHHHAATAKQKPSLDQGKKWVTDAPLREGMGRIRDTVLAVRAKLMTGSLEKKEAQGIQAKIEDEVQKMIASCHLSTGADANFHLILAEILDAKQKLSGSAASVKAAGEKFDQGLALFAEYFAPTGWEKSEKPAAH